MIFQIPERNATNLYLEKKVGEYLEAALEKAGFEITLPTDADWGYVFRIKYDRQLFDIVIKLLSGTEISVSIETIKELFGARFSKNIDIEKKMLEAILQDLCKRFPLAQI